MSEFDEAYQRMEGFGGRMMSHLAGFKAEIDGIRAGTVKLANNCPSRASAIATFHLSKFREDLDELEAALKDASSAIWDECG